MELKQSATGTTLLAIEDYNSNAVTFVSDGNEKRMLVSTRIAFEFFTMELPQLNLLEVVSS